MEKLTGREHGRYIVATTSGTEHHLDLRAGRRGMHRRVGEHDIGMGEKPVMLREIRDVRVGSSGVFVHNNSSYLYSGTMACTSEILSIDRAAHSCVRCGWPALLPAGHGCWRCLLLGRRWWATPGRRARLWTKLVRARKQARCWRRMKHLR